MLRPVRLPTLLLALALTGLLLSAAGSAGAQAPSVPAPPAKPPAADAPKPYAEVAAGKEKLDGLLTLYRSEKGELWLDVPPALLERPFFLQITAETGLGGFKGGLATGDPLYDLLFRLKRVHEQVVLSVEQTNYRAPAGHPAARSVARSFGGSILGKFKIDSQPHPETKAVLASVTSLFTGDLPAVVHALNERLKTQYSLDGALTRIEAVRCFPRNVEVQVAAGLTGPKPTAPDTIADGRSAELRVRYSFIALDDNDYRPRRADPRVGYFITAYQDLADDDPREQFTRYIQRWNLRKKDPRAALSPPREPIVFWLDNAIPPRYRKPIADGVLLWNRAFEKIGIQGAIEVKQIPDGEEFDPFDIRHNVVRWATSSGDGYAVALMRTHPLTGEILHADIRVDSSMVSFTRQANRLEDELVRGSAADEDPRPASPHRCERGARGAREAAAALAILDLDAAPGGVPASERERFIDEYVTELLAHEMGHCLGLRHNFHASTFRPLEELNDREKTGATGLVSSVMDYTVANIAPPGRPQGHYFSIALGPYDLWAIEYGYSHWPELDTPEKEQPALDRIAARSAEPALAYATDEDVVGDQFAAHAADPLAAQWDLSSDPIAFARRRARMVRGLFAKVPVATPAPGRSYSDTRRKFNLLLEQYLRAFPLAARYIGGVHFSRSFRTDAGAPPTPFRVVPGARQREALSLIKSGLFEERAFAFSPDLLNRLAPDKDWHWGVEPFQNPMVVSVPERVLRTQRAVLQRLFSPGLLARVRDNEARVARPEDTLTTAELFQGIASAIFAELRAPRGKVRVTPLRRELQRDFAGTLIGLYLAPSGMPADAQALARYHLRGLEGAISQVRRREGKGMDTATAAHLDLLLERVRRALRAQHVVG